ncbi:MAG: type I polyketide synthase, partial [Proteobacteria bacterium]|nr:type I polyketide synthase [Pseudomonadota bacterium]
MPIDQRDTKQFDGSEIAVIGMAGRFPGANTIEEYWDNLCAGRESVSFFTDKELLESGVDPALLKKTEYVKARPIIEHIADFDSTFFGFSPLEANFIDPQHRLFLECVWQAIETAGYNPEEYPGAISVFAGASMNSYLHNNIYANPEAMAAAGSFQGALLNNVSSLTTLIAYKLNLKGACYSVQTFCSTSLVAVHLACQNLLNYECDLAVAGGVSVVVPQQTGYPYEEGLILSPDGHCRPFSDDAQGTLFGNGLGVVVLKRLEDALADGDAIDAIIIGSAVNNDGSLKASYAAPSIEGQKNVIIEALANAAINPETISYVEAHGTGTALGDPTEIAALTKAFRSMTPKNGFCAIGSVKGNIGHLDVAAGVAGLIKTVLALKNRQIPPSINFNQPNPNINFSDSPFFVNSRLTDWNDNQSPRRAGISSFGVGGTNAHMILEEAPRLPPPTLSRRKDTVLLLSAGTPAALEKMQSNLHDFLESNPTTDLSDIAYTLQLGRKAFNHRRMFVCQGMANALSTIQPDASAPAAGRYQDKRDQPIVFMFSGQGSQYVNMGRELYTTEKVFQEHVDSCAEIL